MQPRFSTLIGLTLLCSALLLPFAISAIYLPALRDSDFKLHEIIRGDIYKQITGYLALAFVLMEMILTLRKRGRQFFIKVSLPGSMKFWRRLHIFAGVALLGLVLIHTAGATGQNFNSSFLWVFFWVTLSALVGVVAETGILESSQQRFYFMPNHVQFFGKRWSGIPKGALIKSLRSIWLSLHILLVSVFFVFLGFHIFLAYKFQ